MKLRKIIAGILAFALVVTAVPLENLQLVKAEDSGVEGITGLINASNDDYVEWNKYSAQGESLGDDDRDNIRTDKPALYEQPIGIYTVEEGTEEYRWPYAALKVYADEDKEYNLSINVNTDNTAVYETFGMIVDGVMHVLKFTKNKNPFTVNTSIRLSKGHHVIVFTTPMPENSADAAKVTTADDWKVYRWFNFHSFELKDGLKAVKGLTKSEVAESVQGATRIEAEDKTRVTYNSINGSGYGYQDSDFESNNNASGSTVVGGVSNAIIKQTEASIMTYLDKQTTPYVQYAVDAPEDGTYNIRVGYLANKDSKNNSTTLPYCMVIVNDNAYKAQCDNAWGKLDAVNLSVDLKKGTNIIRCTSFTYDQFNLYDSTTAGSWACINHDFLEVQAGLNVAAPSTVTTVSNLTTALLPNKYSDQTASQFAIDDKNQDRDVLRYTDKPSIENFLSESFTKLNHWPWISLKVNAPNNGYYDITIPIYTTGSSASGQVAMLIDGSRMESKKFTVSGDNETLDASTYLTSGVHTIVLTTPIPELKAVADAVTDGDAWKYYPWFNYKTSNSLNKFTLAGLTLLDPDESLLSSTMPGVEAEDTKYVQSESFVQENYPGASEGVVLGGVTSDSQGSKFSEISSSYLEWNKTDSVQFAVNASSEGVYDLTFGLIAARESSSVTGTPKVAVLVNDTKIEVPISEWNKVVETTIEVPLYEGNNIVLCTAATSDVKNVKVAYDYFEVESGLTFVEIASLKTETAIPSGDETRVFANMYDDAGSTLEDKSGSNATYNPIRDAKISLDNLSVDNLRVVPYAAIEATADYSGYYDISLSIPSMRNNENIKIYANHIGILIDGVVYPVQFSVAGATAVKASIYLESGSHTIVFTMPMPLLQETANNTGIATNDRYPWANMGTITLYGLTVADNSAPTLADVENHPDYNRIEAEDEKYVVYNKYDTKDSSTISSGRYLMGGVSETNDIKWNYSDLVDDSNNLDYLNKKSLPYVQYAVFAPHEEGTEKYDIRVAYYANYNNNDKPYIGVIVNDKVMQAQFTGASDTIGIIELEVDLKPGINIIRCTSHTLEQTANTGWINQDFLDVDKRLTAVSVAQQSFAGDSDYVVGNQYPDIDKNDSSLGNAFTGNLRSDKPTIKALQDNFSSFDINRWPWTILKVDAPENGYYDISVDIGYDNNTASEHIAMIVDCGVEAKETVYALPFKVESSTDAIVDASVYLTEGVHTIIFTTAMPKDADDLANAETKQPYPWFNFDKFTLGQGLEADDIGMSLADTETKIEAEDSSYVTYRGEFKNKVAIDESNGTVLVGAASDADIEVRKDSNEKEYINWGKVTYVEYGISSVLGGKHDITLRMKVEGAADLENAIVKLFVNGTIYEATATTSWSEVKFENVELQEGMNVIRTAVIDMNNKVTNIAYDWLEVKSESALDGFALLTQVNEVLTEVDAVNKEDVAANRYDNDGSKLFDFTCSKDDEDKMAEAEANGYDISNALVDLRYDILSVEKLPDYYEGDNLQRIPYAAVEVTVAEGKSGYYDIKVDHNVKTGENASEHIGLLVDGKESYSLSFEKASDSMAGITLYLEEGTHLLVFTTPMPETAEDTKGLSTGNADAYPWYDLYSFTFGNGLTIEAAPTNEEVENMFYDRIEAEDKDYVSYNGYNADSLETSDDSSGLLVGGVKQGNLKQTYDDLTSYLDKKSTSYVQYTIEAKEAGTYKVRVGFLADVDVSKSEDYTNKNDVPKSYAVVLVNNDQAYKAQYDEKSWKNIDTATVTVDLEKGVNIIRVTSLTTDQKAYKVTSWINQDFLDIEKNDNLSVVANGEVVALEGKDARIVSNNLKLASDGKSFTTDSGTIGDLRWDRVSVETLAAKTGTLNSLDLTRMPWAAVRVTADHTGYYDISLNINTNVNSTSNNIALILIDEESTEVKALPFNVIKSGSIVDASMFMEEGKTYTLMFSTPMPEKAADVPESKTDSAAYPWIDFNSITLDEGLTVESLVADVTPTIEAEDAENVVHSGAVKGFLDTSDGKVVETEATLDKTIKAGIIAGYFDLGAYNYVEHAVEASEAGNYKLTLNMIASAKDTYAVVVVNGAIYKAKAPTDRFADVEVEVALAKGTNVIRILSVTESDAEDTRLLYDYIDYAKTLKTVAVEDVAADTTINAGDEAHVLSNYYADKGDTLESADYGDLRYDALTLDVVTVDNLSYMPYAAVKVTAEADGFYDVGAAIQVNTNCLADQIGLIVDGTTTYVMKYDLVSSTNVSGKIYLTVGTHTLVFTSPMPETATEYEEYAKANALTSGNSSTHPWMNFVSFAFGKGLTVEKVPTVAEVENPHYNRIESDDSKYVLYNGYTSEAEKAAKASGGYVVGGVKRWLMEQSFEDLKVWIDASNSHTPYVEYVVEAPADGEYTIRAGFIADVNKNVANRNEIAKPFVAVLVNNDIYKAQYTADWGESEAVAVKVDLKKGRNIIRVTSYTTDQEIFTVSSWVNQDFLDLDKRLTAVERTTTVVEAEDSKFINLLTSQDGSEQEKASNNKVLGSAKTVRAKSIGLTLENFTLEQIRMIPYFSYTVEAPMDGYYSLSMNFGADGRMPKSQVAVIVDDEISTVRYNRTGSSTDKNTAIITVYLTKGEHNLTITSPMPLNAEDMANTDWSHRWMNFDYVTFHDGLKLAKTQKSPTTIEDLVRIEAEDVGLPNMTRVNEAAEGADETEGYVGGAKYRRSQKVAEIKKDGIDERKTPFVQYIVNAKKGGTYTAYFSASYGIYKPTVEEMDATVAIEVNGEITFHKVHCVKDKTNSSLIPVTMKLSAGNNVVRLTHLTGDSVKGEGYCWIDYNYIEVSAADNKQITFMQTTGVIEAEDSEVVSYRENSSSAASGGQILGNADYSYIDENDITFENLDVNNLGELSRVTYTVMAEQAGTYYLSVQFSGGVTNYTFNELVEKGEIGFAVSVNESEKQLVEFCPDAGSGILSRIVEVDLQAGENKVMVTATLADYMAGVSPRVEDEYRLYWIDQDALRLSTGVTPVNIEVEPYDVNDTDIDHAQLTPDDSEDVVDVDDNELNIGIIIGLSSLLLLVLLFIFIFLKKKKKDGEEQKKQVNTKG